MKVGSHIAHHRSACTLVFPWCPERWGRGSSPEWHPSASAPPAGPEASCWPRPAAPPWPGWSGGPLALVCWGLAAALRKHINNVKNVFHFECIDWLPWATVLSCSDKNAKDFACRSYVQMWWMIKEVTSQRKCEPGPQMTRQWTTRGADFVTLTKLLVKSVTAKWSLASKTYNHWTFF